MTSADKVIQFVFLVWDRVTSAEYALTNSIIFCCCSVFCLYKNISDWTLKFWQMWKQQSYRFFFLAVGFCVIRLLFFFIAKWHKNKLYRSLNSVLFVVWELWTKCIVNWHQRFDRSERVACAIQVHRSLEFNYCLY